MNRKRTICLIFLIAILSLCVCGSGTEMQDGFYTAEMSDYSHGWKEYVCIMVKNDQIVYVEFNAKDPSGYIKAWDNAYMENMVTVSGTYPNEYTRYYAAKLLEKQNSGVDALTGASSSGGNFNRLTAAVMEQAAKGDHDVIVVETAE